MSLIGDGEIIGITKSVDYTRVLGNIYLSNYCNLGVESINISGFMIIEPLGISMGEVYKAKRKYELKETCIPIFKKEEEWVQRYQLDFGAEPTFF